MVHTLDNGLRVVVNHDPTTPMAAVNLLYNVGGRDEDPNLTGMAHLFEHLMFGGSANIPDFDRHLEMAGGWSNAWTSNDFTCFYDVVPAVNIDTALWLESDRMLALAFSEKALEVQRSVVIEEFKQTCLNRPYGDLMHHLGSLLYTVHPYRYPVIGKEIAHIEKVTNRHVRQFFNSHYAPNNAVLAISGNIEPTQALEKVSRWFADVPRRQVAERTYPAEPERTAPTEATVHGRVPQPMIVVAYPMPGYGDPGYESADMITDILSAGRSARFHQNLVLANPLFTRADASIIGSEEPGFIMLTASLSRSDSDSVRRAIDALTAEAAKLAISPIDTHELTRAINRYESSTTFDNLGYLARAQRLALAAMHDEDPDAPLQRYRALTPDLIHHTARQLLRPEKAATLIYLPEE